MALNSKQKLLRRQGIITLVAIAIVFLGVFTATMQAFANNGSSGTGNGATGGECVPAGYTGTMYWDTCYGASWRRYEAASDWIVIPTEGNVDGGVVKNCKTNGGYYYRLGLEKFNPQTLASHGSQAGLVRVNQLKSSFDSEGKGSYNFVIKNGSLEIAKVRENFEKALAAGITGFSTDWATTAWFCWDLALENPQTGFQSKSTVSSGSESSTSPSWDADAATIEVQADIYGKATVTFSHQLHYEVAAVSGTYENASTSWRISTDGLPGVSTNTWSTPGGASADSNQLPTDTVLTVEVDLGEAEEKTVCSTISYITKTVKWDNSTPRKMLPENDTGSTKACAIIKANTVQVSGDILFWPQSSVESVAEKDVAGHKEWTSEDKNKADGDSVSLRLSTDYNKAKASFQHKIHWEVDMRYTFGANDTWESSTMCTTYTVKLADGGTDTGTACPSSPPVGSGKTTGSKTVDGKQNFEINVPSNPNNPIKEIISYTPKTIAIAREEIKYACPTLSQPNKMCSYNPKRWKYYGAGGSGSGSSSADITYDSPNEPVASNGPSSGNRSNSRPMYAGETTSMYWWAEAEAVNTRRIIGYQSVVFQVMNHIPYDGNKLKGDLIIGLTANAVGQRYADNPGGRSHSDPCGYWSSQPKFSGVLRGCSQVEPGDTSLNNANISLAERHSLSNNTTGIPRTLVVPDRVGDKYCNSFGYYWQYYYGVRRKSDGNSWVWRPDNQTYWTHYDAACRTIAKKPSLAVWNGGVFTSGGILTSTAARYNNTNIATIAYGSANALYGSWTEHLAVAGSGAIDGFGSGASLAFGSGLLSVSPDSNSPLSIRNDILLGGSNIIANPTIVSRLASYIGSLPETQAYPGDVSISSNIINSGSYTDIYQLPQTIIYAPNATTVNISGSVSQIDAWIIAPNATINTCSDFTGAVTETLPAGSNHPCDRQLQINGPVIAKSVNLRRTAGADNIYGGWDKFTPGEIFNLSTDTYLWAYAQAGRYGSSYSEAYSRELPPRY